MTDLPDGNFIVDRIEADVVESIGRYFTPARRGFEVDGDGLLGYRRVETFGEDGVLTATTSDGRTFTIVRWQLGGAAGDIPSPIGDATMMQATGNPVTIDGLTIVESGPDGYTIRRFADWLAVYAQLGVVFPGRPVGMAGTELRDPTELIVERRRGRLPDLDPEAP